MRGMLLPPGCRPTWASPAGCCAMQVPPYPPCRIPVFSLHVLPWVIRVSLQAQLVILHRIAPAISLVCQLDYGKINTFASCCHCWLASSIDQHAGRVPFNSLVLAGAIEDGDAASNPARRPTDAGFAAGYETAFADGFPFLLASKVCSCWLQQPPSLAAYL